MRINGTAICEIDGARIAVPTGLALPTASFSQGTGVPARLRGTTPAVTGTAGLLGTAPAPDSSV